VLAGTASIIAIVSATSLFSGTAQAQQTAATPPAAPSTVEQVVVTAERRAVNVQTTSISMSVLGGNALQEQKVVEISDLQTASPGLSVTNSGLTQNINIRGLGNTTISPAITVGVSVFRDGLYEPEAILLNEPFYDIADVDVERGPQGTIVGQNSTGGAVLINSKNPTFTGVNGYIEAEVGNYTERKVDGAVNLPINDQWAARIAFNYRTRDSFYTNVGQADAQGSGYSLNNPGAIDEKNVRVSVIYKPNDNFQALLKVELNRLNTDGIVGRPLPPCSTCAPSSSNYQYGYANLKPFQIDYAYPESDNQFADRYGLELKWKLDNGITLRSLTGIQDLRENKTDDVGEAYAPHEPYDFHVIGPQDDYYQQEFDILSPDTGKFTWLVGASYFYRTTPVRLTQYAEGEGLPVPGTIENSIFSIDQSSIQRLAGVFGQATYQLTNTLQFQIGGRYSADATQNGGFVYPLGAQIPLQVSLSGNYTVKEPTGKVGLNWKPTDTQYFYVFAARGFKDGGFAGPGDLFQAETVNDYEGGVKSQWLGGRLRTQIGGYYMQYDNMQQQIINPNVGNGGVYNIGASTIYGLEASAQARLNDWTIDAGLALNHSSLGSIKAIATYQLPGGGSANLGPQCGAVQTASCFNYTPYTVSLSGESNPYSPAVTFNTDVAYNFHLNNGWTVVPRVNYSYVDNQYASIFQNTSFYLLKAHSLVDASVSFNTSLWTVQVWAKNLANTLYLAGITSSNFGEWGDPRTFGISVRRTF
jgi:iron complex outermembrane receptor protein